MFLPLTLIGPVYFGYRGASWWLVLLWAIASAAWAFWNFHRFNRSMMDAAGSLSELDLQWREATTFGFRRLWLSMAPWIGVFPGFLAGVAAPHFAAFWLTSWLAN